MKPIGLVTISFEEPIKGLAQVMNVVRNEIGHVPVFGLVPNIVDRVEFRRIGGKPLDLKPLCAARLQQPDSGTMCAQASANENDGTT